MDEETWAIENETFATTDLLETKIMVCTKCTQGYKWVTHNPSTQVNSVQKLYLINMP
jgi:hypothetical protein